MQAGTVDAVTGPGESAPAVRPIANVPAASGNGLLALAVDSSVRDRQLWLHIAPPVADRALDDTAAKNRLGELKSAEQLPARRFPRADGCRLIDVRPQRIRGLC